MFCKLFITFYDLFLFSLFLLFVVDYKHGRRSSMSLMIDYFYKLPVGLVLLFNIFSTGVEAALAAIFLTTA